MQLRRSRHRLFQGPLIVQFVPPVEVRSPSVGFLNVHNRISVQLPEKHHIYTLLQRLVSAWWLKTWRKAVMVAPSFGSSRFSGLQRLFLSLKGVAYCWRGFWLSGLLCSASLELSVRATDLRTGSDQLLKSSSDTEMARPIAQSAWRVVL
jgi:hypothetical protein